MIVVTFRALSPGAAYLSRIGKRLGRRMLLGGKSAAHQVVDGYLLRATKTGEDRAKVYAIDPATSFAFLRPHFPGNGQVLFLAAAQHLSRDALRPGSDLSALEYQRAHLGEGETPATLRKRWSPGFGYCVTYYSDATVAQNASAARNWIAADRACSVVRMGDTSTTDTFNSYNQLYITVFGRLGQRWLALGADTSAIPGTARQMQDCIIPDEAVKLFTGDTDAKLIESNNVIGESYRYSVPYQGAQVAAEGLVCEADETGAPVILYRDLIVGGGYVSQPSTSEAAAVGGHAGLFVARVRRPVIEAAIYPLEVVWQFGLSQLDNANPALVPALELESVVVSGAPVDAYTAHGVSDVAIAHAVSEAERTAAAPGDALGVTGLYATLFCAPRESDPPEAETRYATQLYRFEPNGAQSMTEIALTGPRLLGPQVRLFGKDGIAATTFALKDTSRGLVIDPGSVALVHIDLDGVVRPVDLGGWWPYTDYLHNPTTESAGHLLGADAKYAVDIGNGKVGVIARNALFEYVAGGNNRLRWSLIVVDAASGTFIEARGAIGDPDGPTGTDGETLSTAEWHLSVIQQETQEAPAVLLCRGPSRVVWLSADGGMTWKTLFFNEATDPQYFAGYPLYLGQPIAPAKFNTAL